MEAMMTDSGTVKMLLHSVHTLHTVEHMVQADLRNSEQK